MEPKSKGETQESVLQDDQEVSEEDALRGEIAIKIATLRQQLAQKSQAEEPNKALGKRAFKAPKTKESLGM